MIFDKPHYSLQVGKPFRLAYDVEGIHFKSNHPHVYVREGVAMATRDFRQTATIEAVNNAGKVLDTCEITVVPWNANTLIADKSEVDRYGAFINVDNMLYAYKGNDLYRTLDGFENVEYVGKSNLSLGNYPILDTPFGFFARQAGQSGATGAVYRSTDLLNWNLSYDNTRRGLYHSFDYHFDEAKQLLYVYVGEYTTGTEGGVHNTDRAHKVHRGVIDSDSETWDVALEFDPENSEGDLKAYHIHVVTVDKYTGDIWVGTGDSNQSSRIIISQDNGETWKVIGAGSQDWRCLSIWFTEDYIYWNMDTSSSQSIWRLKRSDLPFQSPENDLKERVALLEQGSMWYHCWAKFDNRNWVIMGQSAEGARRDGRGRIYAISEDGDEIHELFTTNDAGGSSMIQWEPKIQDNAGFVYVNGRSTEIEGTVRCRLRYNYRPYRYKWVTPTFAQLFK